MKPSLLLVPIEPPKHQTKTTSIDALPLVKEGGWIPSKGRFLIATHEKLRDNRPFVKFTTDNFPAETLTEFVSRLRQPHKLSQGSHESPSNFLPAWGLDYTYGTRSISCAKASREFFGDQGNRPIRF